jgi:membrane protein implicated in regulation of membrane protease activity
MGLITAFGRFLYDFIVGDAWEIAAGIVLVLVLGIAALRVGAVSAQVLPVLMGAGIVLVVSLSLLWEARRRIKAA